MSKEEVEREKEKGIVISKSNILFYNNDQLKEKYCYYSKDNLCSRNFPTTSSCNFLIDFQPGYDSFAIRQLEKKGYILLGKTVLDELSCGGTGLLANSGALYHPIDNKHIVGGSSSGSALVVKQNLVPFSLASDTGGSIRVPAAYCGILGFKPSYGSISRSGLIPYCTLLDTVGVLSNDLEILKEVFTALIERKDGNDLWTSFKRKRELVLKKRLADQKIAIVEGIEKYLSKEYLNIYNKLLEKLEKIGYQIVSVTIPSFIKKNLSIGWIIVCFSELVSHLNCLQGVTFGVKDSQMTVKEKRTKFLNSVVRKRILLGSYFLKRPKKMLEVYHWRQETEGWIKSLFKKQTFFIFPTTITESPLATEDTFLSLGNKNHWSDNLTLLSNLTHIPSINLPLGLVNNLPVGICINANQEEEDKIFKLSEEIINSLEKNNPKIDF